MQNMVCNNCGSEIDGKATFCIRCGAKNEAKEGRVCGKCNNVIKEGLFFCPFCGTKAVLNESPIKQPKTMPLTGGKLVISRDSQFACMACDYKITINGMDYGNIAAGNKKTINVHTPIIEIEIACTTIMMKAQRIRLKLRLGNNPHVQFRLEHGGRIIPTVIGAEILQTLI